MPKGPTSRAVRAACCLIALVVSGLGAPVAHAAGTFFVDAAHPAASDRNRGTADAPFRTISRAADRARAGDTVIVRAGLYRETVVLESSGTPGKPIRFVADPVGSVIVSGADIIDGFSRLDGDAPVFGTHWPHTFAINHDDDGNPVEHHPDDEPLWGRAEQVIVDGQLLLPVGDLGALRKVSGPPQPPVANLGGPFAGWFTVDTGLKMLYVRLADGSDPSPRVVEASTRDLLFGVTPFMNKHGVRNVHVSGFVFRDAATFPQRSAVWLHGADNVLEDCVIERMAGTGVNVKGTMRRCVVRNNGHTGGGASGDGFVNEDNLWEGNSWKPVGRGWEAGGQKIVECAGGTYRRCTFRRNGGPGLWLDVDVRDTLITDCVFEENETSGLFVEISQGVTVVNNLAVRNGIGVIGDGDAWGVAGIQIAESMNCLVANNTCVGNKDGITLREQGPRRIPTDDRGPIDYHNAGHTIVRNVLADNRGYQLALWYDNAFFGPHPSQEESDEDEVRYDPAEQNLIIDANRYHGERGRPLVLYGVTWRRGHEEFFQLADLARHAGFERLGQEVDAVDLGAFQRLRGATLAPATRE